MMILEHLAIVQSPLQLIGVRSFVKKRGLDKSRFRLVVRAPSNTSSGRALYKELCNDRDAWGDVVCLQSKRKLLPVIALVRKCKRQSWGSVVFGDVRAWWMKIIVANLAYDEKVLVDDGTSTIFDYEKFMVTGDDYQKNNKEKDLLVRALGLNSKEENVWPLRLFTLFSLPETPYVTVEPGFSLNEEVFCQSGTEDDVLAGHDSVRMFIGQPIVGDDKVSLSSYIAGIRFCLSRPDENPVIYFAHRGEDDAVLEKVCHELGVPVVKNSSPVEWVIHQNIEKIAGVLSFCSTAMFTAKLISREIPVITVSLEGAECNDGGLVERCGLIQKYLLSQPQASILHPEY